MAYRKQFADNAGKRLSRMTEGYSQAGKFARGGGVKKHHGKTNVNVIVAPQGGAQPQPVPIPVPPPGPGPMLPKPPMAGGPPGMGPGMPPGMPPGAPPGMPMRKHGGAVKDGPAWKEGLRNGTQVKNSPGKNDVKDINRPPVVTKAHGGRISSEKMHTPTIKHAAGGGLGRLEKIKMEHGR